MSDDPKNGASTIRASKGSGGTGGAKWLLGAAAAAVVLGGGYLVWKNYSPAQTDTQAAYNDNYSSEPNAGPLPSDQSVADNSASQESVATASSDARPAASSGRRSTAAVADEVPEETIGITPVNATSSNPDDENVVVTAPRRPVWAEAPSARRLSALYPARALQYGREGEASLHCTVQLGGALDCVKVEETPGGFGTAALRVAHTLRHAPQLADGRDAAGTPVNLRVVFRIPEDTRHG